MRDVTKGLLSDIDVSFGCVTRPPLLAGGVLEEALELEPPTPPTVRVSSTIRVNLERGGTGECYVWTREEATMVRDALDSELNDRRTLTQPFQVQPWNPNQIHWTSGGVTTSPTLG